MTTTFLINEPEPISNLESVLTGPFQTFKGILCRIAKLISWISRDIYRQNLIIIAGLKYQYISMTVYIFSCSDEFEAGIIFDYLWKIEVIYRLTLLCFNSNLIIFYLKSSINPLLLITRQCSTGFKSWILWPKKDIDCL